MAFKLDETAEQTEGVESSGSRQQTEALVLTERRHPR